MGSLTNIGLLAVMVVAFYFVLIRPQQRRLKQHQSLVSNVKPGDEVVTIGGIYGYIKRIDQDKIWLEVAEGTVLRISRQAIGRTVPTEDEVAQEIDASNEGNDEN